MGMALKLSLICLQNVFSCKKIKYQVDQNFNHNTVEVAHVDLWIQNKCGHEQKVLKRRNTNGQQIFLKCLIPSAFKKKA